MQKINVGLIGLGTVGGEVARYFTQGRLTDKNIYLKRAAVAHINKARAFKGSLTKNVSDILNDPDIQIVVEVMGGINPAKDYILEAISKGKSIVTANKAVMASHLKDIFDAARTSKEPVNIGFEASVGGGIPIMRILEDYRGEKINKIMGIVNGTTNYILTQMEDALSRGSTLSFDQAVKNAQDQGFAEKDHTLDTDGFDSQSKLSILASLIFNSPVNTRDIPREGILEITPADLDFARKYGKDEGGNGYSIKLIAQAQRQNGHVALRVSPVLISRDHPLSSVRNEFNAITINAELAKEQTFIGKGAGGEPTASAVIRNILQVAENIKVGKRNYLPTLDSKIKYIDSKKEQKRGYLRVLLKHKPGSLFEASRIIAKHKLNIEDSIQRRKFGTDEKGVRFIPDIITIEEAPLGQIQDCLKELEKSHRIYGKPFFLSFQD